MIKRKNIPKERRIEVYNKYDGHCAYCGCDLEYKDMQVDHLIPLQAWDYNEAPANLDPYDIKNLMPACRTCNHYKRYHDIEVFRKMIENIPKKLGERQYIYKVGMKYNFFDNKPKKVTFYFEQFD